MTRFVTAAWRAVVSGETIQLQLTNLEAGDELDEKARQLEAGGNQFRIGARQAKRNECIADFKMKVIIGSIVSVIVRDYPPPSHHRIYSRALFNNFRTSDSCLVVAVFG